METSPFKRPFVVDAKRNTEESSEDSDEPSEDEERVSIENRDKETSWSRSDSNEKIHQIEQNEESDEKSENEDMETQDESFKNEQDVIVSQSPAQYVEVSDDDDDDDDGDENIGKIEERAKTPKIEDGECDSFQSFSNSVDNAAALESIVQCGDAPMKNVSDNAHDNLTGGPETRHVLDQDYELSQCFKLNRGQVQSNYRTTGSVGQNRDDECSDEERNYSLTKPIFLDNRGMVKFGEPTPDITDDESMDDAPVKAPELESVIQSQNEVEGEENDDDLKLNLSSSDDNVPEIDQVISSTSTRTNGLSNPRQEVDLLDSSPISKPAKLTSTKKSSLVSNFLPLNRSFII